MTESAVPQRTVLETITGAPPVREPVLCYQFAEPGGLVHEAHRPTERRGSGGGRFGTAASAAGCHGLG